MDSLKTNAPLGAGVGVAVGLTVATGVLPQIATALNPTGWGTVAIAAFSAFLGVAVQQWTTRTSRGAGASMGWFSFCAVGAVAILVATVALDIMEPRWLQKPRSVGDQINSKLAQLVDHGQNHVVVNERVQLHPGDQPSWLVVIEHSPAPGAFVREASGDQASRTPVTSDEILIYDIDEGWLTLKLDYQPVGVGKTARRWIAPAGESRDIDYSDNGFPEIIAGYSEPDAYDSILPFIIYWTGSQYVLHAITPHAPTLPTTNFGTGPPAQTLLSDRHIWYLTPTSLPNQRHGTRASRAAKTLRGYQVAAFALVTSPAVRLLTGYFSALPTNGDTKTLEMRSNQISTDNYDLLACHAGWHYCPAPTEEEDVQVPAASSLDKGLLVSRWFKSFAVRVGVDHAYSYCCCYRID